jgi:hypothetical protein
MSPSGGGGDPGYTLGVYPSVKLAPASRRRTRRRSRNMSRASQSMDERLRKMNGQASTLDNRLSRHTEEGMRGHTTWDDTSRPG